MSENTLPKEPLAVRIMNFWNSLSPEFRYSILYITSALITLLQQLLQGFDWKTAVVTFLGALLTQINAMQAVSKVAKERVIEGDKSEPTLGITPETIIPDSHEVTPIN